MATIINVKESSIDIEVLESRWYGFKVEGEQLEQTEERQVSRKGNPDETAAASAVVRRNHPGAGAAEESRPTFRRKQSPLMV